MSARRRRIARSRRPGRLVAGVLSHYLRKHPKDAVLLGLWSVVEAVPTFAFGRAMSGATNDFVAGRSHLVAGMIWLGVMIVAAAVGSLGSAMAYRRLAALVEPLRDDLVRRTVTGAVSRCVDFGEPPDAGASARISHQTEIVRDSFGGLLSALRRFAFIAGSALIGLATLLPMALVLAVGPLVAGITLFFMLVGPLVRQQRAYVLTEEAVAATGGEIMASLRDITACGGEDRTYAKGARRVNAQVRAAKGVARVSAARSLAISVGGTLPIPLVLVAAPWLVRQGASAGQIVGALAYLAGGLNPALRTLVSGLGNSGVRMAVTLDRIMTASSLQDSPDADQPYQPRESLSGGMERVRRSSRVSGSRIDVELRGLRFAYGPRAIPVISDLTLDIPDGDHLAIVGPSGVGKSTLAGLISGTLSPDAGVVRIGGVPIRQLSAAELADRRVLIPQEAYVFSGTLTENLTYLDPDADSLRVREAAELMGLRPLVSRLGGYHAIVDPSTLSAGERQLIALTRAYLSPARLVLLDEATCHLDATTEANAEHAFAGRQGALVVIAHRMSSALRARRILVLDGDQACVGTHDSLLERSPLYRDLAGYWKGTDQSQPAPSAIRMASTRVRAPVLPIARDM